MWIFKNDAFVSIVEDRHNSDHLWVRARVKGDLEKFFKGVLEPPQLKVMRTKHADYLFRAVVQRDTVAAAMQMAVLQVDYPNFKNSIAPTKEGDLRHDAYMGVWTKMLAYQHAFKRRFKK